MEEEPTVEPTAPEEVVLKEAVEVLVDARTELERLRQALEGK